MAKRWTRPFRIGEPILFRKGHSPVGWLDEPLPGVVKGANGKGVSVELECPRSIFPVRKIRQWGHYRCGYGKGFEFVRDGRRAKKGQVRVRLMTYAFGLERPATFPRRT